MRICSLLPSNTEILFALDLGDDIVGVTHECDYPQEVGAKRVVTSSVVPSEGMNSKEIHKAISELVHKGSSIYHLDYAALQEASPDLILTQELCAVCAVSYKEVKTAARILEADSKIVSLEPNTLQDILNNIALVGELTGRNVQANQLVSDLQSRIDKVARITSQVSSRPKVFCLEWLDPPFVAGHWVPEMVELAGGEDGLGQKGKPSTQTDWGRILDYDPDIVVIMPCGFGIQRALQELERVRFPQEWKKLSAVQRGDVFVVDGSSYYNRPGPRVVDGLDILARIIHPELFPTAEHRFSRLFKTPHAVT